MTNWIKVEDELPEHRQYVLAYGSPTCGTHSPDIVIEFCLYTTRDGFEFGEYDCGFDATHWMKLPSPPILEEKS